MGRSGTGKTTILREKLCRRQVEAEKGPNQHFLRQLFVTVSPRLCAEVKRDVSDSCHRSISSHDPETFSGLPRESYPVIITFQKFLMMLDITLGNSFFKQFDTGNCTSAFIGSKNVTFDRFLSDYWPLIGTQKLDPTTTFTEIISYIKGGVEELVYDSIPRAHPPCQKRQESQFMESLKPMKI